MKLVFGSKCVTHLINLKGGGGVLQPTYNPPGSDPVEVVSAVSMK